MSKNVTVAGASYSDVPSVALPQTGGGTASFFDVSDTTATASDVASGKWFYLSSGQKVQGAGSGGTPSVTQDQDGYIVLDDDPGPSITVESLSVTTNGTYTAQSGHAYSPVTVNVSGGSAQITPGILRPDAELVQTWSYDKYIVADENVTIPAYTTTLTTLKASETLTTSTGNDLSSYDYGMTCWYLATPVYSSETVGAGRFEVYASCNISDWVDIRNNEIVVKGNDVGFTSNNSISYSTCISRASDYMTSTTMSYGASLAHHTMTQNTYSGDVTAYSPDLRIRGHSTYFSQTFWELLTDIRYQYVIKLYRIEKGAANIDGLERKSALLHIFDCYNSASGTLS